MRAALILALSAATLAGGAPDEKPTPAYGDDHPAGREWSDGCIVCRRGDDGDPACSTPGPACLPAPAACLGGADKAAGGP